MRITCRPLPRDADAAAKPGDLEVRPRPEHAHRGRALAELVHDLGPGALVGGEPPFERIIVDMSFVGPSLDEMLAATFAVERLAGRELPPGCLALARYAELVRQGIRPDPGVPVERSLAAVYQVVKSQAQMRSGGIDPANTGQLIVGWGRLAKHLLRTAEQGLNPFLAPLFDGDPDFARELAFLARDRDLYYRDVDRGEKWPVRLGVKDREETGWALLLRKPWSVLFRAWARQDEQAPGGRGYLLLGVHWGKGLWDFSTDPVHALRIDALARVLQQAEVARDRAKAGDPWYDGRGHAYTMIASPRNGTALSEAEVLGLVRRQAAPPRRGWRPTRRQALYAAAGCAAVAAGGGTWWLLRRRAAPTFEVSAAVEPVVAPAPREVALRVEQRGENEARLALTNPLTAPVPARLRVRLGVPAGSPVVLKEVSWNGRALPGTIDKAQHEWEGQFAPGDNALQVLVANPGTTDCELTVRASADLDPAALPTLHVLAIGVSKYQERSRLRQLRAAHTDAAAIAEALKAQKGLLFRQVRHLLLQNEQAKRREIASAFRELGKGVGDNDLVVVALAGHGKLTPHGRYCFLPYDYEDHGDDQVALSSWTWEDINEWLGAMPGQKLVLLDTCHSGAAGRGDAGAAARKALEDYHKAPKGTIVLAACGADELAQEYDSRHGYMTLAVLEAITNRRIVTTQARTPLPSARGEVVTVGTLREYVLARVAELLQRQTPVLRIVQQSDPERVPICVVSRNP